MANCHTIIGAKRFHFRVRDGIGWFTLAMVTKQTGVKQAKVERFKAKDSRRCALCCRFALPFPVYFKTFIQALDYQDFGFRLSSCAFRLFWKSVTSRRCCALLAIISCSSNTLKLIGCYMVKPHGQLVHVSCTHYCASTPCLSTS